MKRIGEVMKPQALLLVIAGLLLVWAALPASASAAELSTQTAQVIPPGGNGCPATVAANFVPYVYDNELNSFDFTMPDASYVALVGSVGDMGVPFNQMTRGVDAQGRLKIHVDIATTPVTSSLPVTVTLLSARPNQPICVSVVSTTLTGTAQAPVAVKPISPVAQGPKPIQPEKPAQSGTSSTSSTPVVSGSFMSSIGQAFAGACATPLAAQRTWLILLLAYMLIVGLALWAEYPMMVPSMRTPERVAGIILVLLLALLAFWYFSASCRTALWMPLAAVLIAVLGLLAAFRNHPRVTQLLLIQSTRRSS